MDHQGRLRRAALESGIPDDEVGRFTDHLRLSIRLSAGTRGAEPPAADDSSLPLVLSVDCAALPRIDGFPLPAGGSLLFFLDHEKDHLAAAEGERKYARVTHVPEGSGLYEATLLAELPDWLLTDDEDEDDDFTPFQEQLALDLERDFPHLDELRALAVDLWPPSQGLARAYLGGYVDDEVMTSIAEQTLAGREKAGEIVIPVAKWYSHVEREKHRLAGEWLSLARFPLPGTYYTASFVIHYDDLAAGRWDRALSVTEFTE
ncbi:hypothetical protein ACGFJ7_34580 [Actinoplanes sp. NPDC048988]|uniref:hypothetical protein n=1 Tax=Actinoplanes sp. NPDC048988 TaxID=3363901 RepID=UPI003714279B